MSPRMLNPHLWVERRGLLDRPSLLRTAQDRAGGQRAWDCHSPARDARLRSTGIILHAHVDVNVGCSAILVTAVPIRELHADVCVSATARR